MDGGAPENATSWGWEAVGGGGGFGVANGVDQVRVAHARQPLDDGRTLYLIPKATHELLNKMAGAETLGLDDRALNDRLGEAE